MNKKTKKILIAAAIVVAVILLVCLIVYWQKQSKTATPSSTNAPTSTAPTATSTVSQPSTKTTAAAPTTSDKNLTYGELVQKYINYRFQFSNNCSATPNLIVLKKGSKFMIDNRENKTHTFIFTGQKYTLKAYGYAIITAQTVGLQYVYCDGIQRTSVNVQK